MGCLHQATTIATACFENLSSFYFQNVHNNQIVSNVLSLTFISGASRAPASPSRSRRNAQNGPSPLVLGSSDDGRRIKVSNSGSTTMAASKPEIKSPPATGSYPQAQSGIPGGVSSVFIDLKVVAIRFTDLGTNTTKFFSLMIRCENLHGVVGGCTIPD